MLGEIIFYICILVLGAMAILHIKKSASSNDEKKLMDELNTDFEEEFEVNESKKEMKSLVEWLEDE